MMINFLKCKAVITLRESKAQKTLGYIPKKVLKALNIYCRFPLRLYVLSEQRERV